MSTIVAQTIIAKSRLPIDSRTFAIGGQMFPSTRQTALSLVPRMRRLSYNSAANESTSLGNLWCCLAFAPILGKRSCASRDQAKINVVCLVLVAPCQHPMNRRQGYHQQKLAAMAIPRVWQEVKFSTLGVVSKDHATHNNLTKACCREIRSKCVEPMMPVMPSILCNHPQG